MAGTASLPHYRSKDPREGREGNTKIHAKITNESAQALRRESEELDRAEGRGHLWVTADRR